MEQMSSKSWRSRWSSARILDLLLTKLKSSKAIGTFCMRNRKNFSSKLLYQPKLASNQIRLQLDFGSGLHLKSQKTSIIMLNLSPKSQTALLATQKYSTGEKPIFVKMGLFLATTGRSFATQILYLRTLEILRRLCFTCSTWATRPQRKDQIVALFSTLILSKH